MTTKRGLLLLAVALVLAGCGSPFGGAVGDHLRDAYRQVNTENGGRSEVFTSAEPVAATASQIATRHRPTDRVQSPQGEFLRYDDVIVGVTPSGAGSQVHLDDRDRGYQRWGAFVGPSWGPVGGIGENSRGGGPGSGK